MGTIRTIFCWLGGVILPAIPELAIHGCQDRSGMSLDYWTRIAIRDLAQELTLGRLDGDTYCERVIQMTGADLPAKELVDAIVGSAILDPSPLEVLAEVGMDREFWLIADYPRNWYTSISAQFTPYTFLQPERSMFTADLGLSQLIPDIFPAVVQKAAVDMKTSLLVDGDTVHAVEAVKHGLQAEIYTSAPRLRRYFTLRKMLPRMDQVR